MAATMHRKVGTYKPFISVFYGLAVILSITLTGCGGGNNNAAQMDPETLARTQITKLFYAVNNSRKLGNYCTSAAEQVDIKHLQIAISLSNEADKSNYNTEHKDKLYAKSADHATKGIEYITKQHCT